MVTLLGLTVLVLFCLVGIRYRWLAEEKTLRRRLSYCLFLFGGTVIAVYGLESIWKGGQIGNESFVALAILLGTFQWAWYNVEAKRVLNDTSTWTGREAAFTSIIFLVSGILLFVSSLATGGHQITNWSISLTSGFLVPVFIDGLLNIVIMFAKTKAKSLENLTIIAPIESSTPAPVIFFGIIILGEWPLVWGWFGIWILALGTYSLGIVELYERIGTSNKEHRIATLEEVIGGSRNGLKFWILLWLVPIISLFKSIGARWAVFAALLSLVSLNFDALALRNANIGFAQGTIWFMVALGNYLFALRQRQFDGLNLSKAFRDLALPAVLMASLCLGLGVVYRATLMSHVASLKRLVIPFTMIGAYLALGEKKNWRGRIVSGVVMTIGITLIGIDIIMRK